MPKNIVQIDRETGEQLQGVMAFMPHRARIKDRFFMAFQDALQDLALNRAIDGEALRVLMFLFGQLDWENHLPVSATDVAMRMKIHRQSVHRALRKLQEAGVLEKGPKTSGIPTWRLNSNYGWKGRATNLTEERKAKIRLAVNNAKKEQPE